MLRPLTIIFTGIAALAVSQWLIGEQQETGPSAVLRFPDQKEEQPDKDTKDRNELRFTDASTGVVREARAGTNNLTAGAKRRDKHAPVDPIEANGPIFVDWPRPDAVLLFSGEQDGYLEPCGCAGLNNQKGGLKRRHTLIKQLRARDWPVLPIDLGGQIRRYGKQAEIKLQRSYESLINIGYPIVAFGPRDLMMDMLAVAINLDPAENPLVSANVGIIDFDSGFTQRYKIVDVGDMRIGVTSVLGKNKFDELKSHGDIVLEEPYQALPIVLPKLIAAKCDQLVLLAHTDHEEAKDLARRFYEFDWVVAADGADEPPIAPSPILDEAGDEVIAQLIECGHKGMFVVVVGLYNDGSFRYQRVPLDHRFEDSSEMQAIFTEYQQELETLGLEGLGIRPVDHPSGRKFAGSAACADCHSSAHEIHSETPHAHATDSLLNLDPPRHHDPECLSCHVIGWHPQKYFPFTSGYIGLEGETATPHLATNGCENCHGPGKAHADAENGEIDLTDEEMEQLRDALRLKIVANEGNQEGQVFRDGGVVEMCMECHDLDNSPDFDFQLYWPEVEHSGLY